jgi:hypothetical protein
MAKARRGRGEGSVRERPDGTWEARLSGGVGLDGTRRRYSAYAKGKKEALAALDKLRADHGQGTLASASSTTLGEYLAAWLRDVVTPTTEAATLQTYDAVIRTHIEPALGKIKISKLKPGQIQSRSSMPSI